MKYKCKVCDYNTKRIRIDQAFFRHLDFSTICESLFFYKCLKCQTISNYNNFKSEEINFCKKEYANSKQTKQTIQVDWKSLPVSRSYLQTKLLSEEIKEQKNQRFLDIGCFDGKLLNELHRKFNDSDLWGYDINPYLKEFFPKKNNFHFISSSLSDIPGKFDLIIMSHSIFYIKNIKSLMKFITNALNDNGLLFIQIPDIRKNIYYSLMGDQSFVFTKTSLKNILMKFGFSSSIIINKYFTRELLFLAKKTKLQKINYEEDHTFEDNIINIKKIESRLKKINLNNLIVLGTTVNAAFVDQILDKSITMFVDEESSKVGSLFRNKNIIHPNDLKSSDNIILPYGDSGLNIKKRFMNLYRGTYIPIN